jgi:ATP/ADP translocase
MGGTRIMNWVDFAVVAIVVVLIGIIVYFSFIRNRKNPNKACRYCAEGAGKKKSRLKKDFDEKYHK